MAKECNRCLDGDRRLTIGVFETGADVKRLGNNVDNRIDTLEADILRLAVNRYGPSGFSASISADQLAQFKADKEFYQAWSKFRTNWKAYWIGELSAGNTFLVLSADHFRRVSEYEVVLRGFETKAAKQGVEATFPEASKMKGNDGLPSLVGDLNKTSDGVKNIAIAAAAVLIGFAVFTAVKK